MKKRYIFSILLTALLLNITHKIWLGKKIAMHFDLMIMLIILILGFLFFLKISSYLADFKKNKNISAVEIIFFVLFIMICTFPVWRLDNSDKSIMENRTLEKYKPLINDDCSLNNNFGKDFENWLADRVFLREKMIILKTNIDNIFSTDFFITKKNVLNKKTYWISSIADARKRGYSDEEIKEMVAALNKLQDYSNKLNTKLYVIIVPTKATIYPDELGYNIEDSLERRKEEQEVVDKLKQNTSVKIIFPQKEMLLAKEKDFTHFKSEHHWTDWGAYIAYKELNNKIIKDITKYKPVQLNEFNKSKNNLVRGDWSRKYQIGTTLKEMPILKSKKLKMHDVEYTYYEHKDKDLLSVHIDKENKIKKFYYPLSKNHHNILLIGTSMNENLLDFLKYSSRNTLVLRLNHVKNLNTKESFKFYKLYNNKIQNYKPDIMIFCLTFNNLKNIQYFFREN